MKKAFAWVSARLPDIIEWAGLAAITVGVAEFNGAAAAIVAGVLLAVKANLP